jgi:hypothetical protein
VTHLRAGEGAGVGKRRQHDGQGTGGGRALRAGRSAGACRPVSAAKSTAALTPAVLERLNPQALGIAVFAADPDAFHALSRLARLGYRGRVLAFAPPLPRRKLVERELRAHAPGLRVRVVCLLALAP